MIAGIAALAGLLVAIASAASFSRDWRWALLAHFRLHLAAAAGALALVIMVVDMATGPKLTLLVVVGAAAAVNLREIVHATRRSATGIEEGIEGQRLRIAFANVWRRNVDHRRVIDWIRREQVDVFVAAEAVQSWPAALAALGDELPHVAGHPWGDVLIFSRHEISGAPQHLFPSVGYALAVEIAGLTLIGLHTASPEDVNHSRACDELIGKVSDAIKRSADPVVVVGDFNAAPWSAPMRRLVAETGLTYGPGARIGSFPAEWAGVKVPKWLAIPIDHVLAGGGASVIERRHGPRVGSDHWPIVAEIGLPRRLDPPDPRP